MSNNPAEPKPQASSRFIEMRVVLCPKGWYAVGENVAVELGPFASALGAGNAARAFILESPTPEFPA